ncbi:hypothetical protein DCO48_11175 [Pseudomonas sp. SDI]|uniref:DUF3077 domain-containing protein n=1 Tax=Pseudomonas sp. SDI TaxID=2170734 RepID=UPI000DE5D9D3|nr:DUF3077 domain-containing protein [Pseudomonas sp. SDI]PWB32951.1 hypothetical protein DCO48_11175 [Pseudomonas sp. SDI]
MNKIVPDPPPAGAPVTTFSTAFASCSGSHDPVFAVRAGVDIEDALVHLSVLLRCAQVTTVKALELAEGEQQSLLWSTQQSLDMSHALTEAVLKGVEVHTKTT